MLSEYALVNTDDVKSYRIANGIKLNTTPDQNILIEDAINSVTTSFESYCDRKFVSRTFTEYHDGNNTSVFYPKNYPIISMTSVNVDDDWVWSSSTLVPSASYRVFDNMGIVLKDANYLDYGKQNVKVVYIAGYDTIPSDLKLACITEVINIMDNIKNVGITSKAEDGLSTSYSQLSFLPTTLQVLNKYRVKAAL